MFHVYIPPEREHGVILSGHRVQHLHVLFPFLKLQISCLVFERSLCLRGNLEDLQLCNEAMQFNILWVIPKVTNGSK